MIAQLKSLDTQYKFWVWAMAFTLILCGTGVAFDSYTILISPIAILVIGLLSADVRISYFGYFVTMPLSVELYFDNGLGTDLPTEPFMLICTAHLLLLLLVKLDKINWSLLINPITKVLLVHLLWLFILIFYSQNALISLKWFLAKLWYVIPFYFGAFYFLYKESAFNLILKLTFWPLLGATLFILARHSTYGFSFDSSNTVVVPIFRNHVNYASALVLFMPFVWYLYSQAKSILMRQVYIISFFILGVGVYFSYTRAAILCLLIGFVSYFIIKYRLMVHTLLVSVIGLIGLVMYLVHDNNYLRFAPDYNKTITHTEFNNLLDATYKLEDISTMERVYRWVAGSNMIAERPLAGFGAGTFYSQYKSYTVNSFKTYVSGNPEKSGVHSYYLMTFIEQGVIGILILFIFLFTILISGERLYHRVTNHTSKMIIMSSLICIIIILCINLINDTLEVDKIGPYFFTSAAMIGIQRYKQKLLNSALQNVSKE